MKSQHVKRVIVFIVAMLIALSMLYIAFCKAKFLFNF